MNYQPSPQDKDPQLWQTAKQRASFKYHLGTFIVMNIFFWVIWYFTGQHATRNGWPWPIWPMIGWGILLLFHSLRAYVYPNRNAVEREYQKLEKNQSK